MSEKTLKELYQENFETDVYYDMYYSKVYDWQEFYMENTFDVFSKGIVSGERVIEFGAGPTIHFSALASKFCESIVTTDFTPCNRENLKLWLNKDPKALDWTKHLKFCAHLEGFSNVDEGAHEISERVRNKIKEVLFCDFTQPNPLEKATDPFDVLITSLCCESSVDDPEDYIAGIKNMTSLVRSKGMVVISGCLNANQYHVGDVRFSACHLTEDVVKEAFARAGLTVRLYKEWKSDTIPNGAGTNVFFFAVFQKS